MALGLKREPSKESQKVRRWHFSKENLRKQAASELDRNDFKNLRGEGKENSMVEYLTGRIHELKTTFGGT